MTHSEGKSGLVVTLFISFLRLGLTAFGGPAMIAHIKELSVRRKGWLDDKTFNDGITLCQAIPGATAMQMAAYVGLKTRGIPGALASYLGFGLPAFFLMLALSAGYMKTMGISWTISLFAGLQVIVVAIVANSTFVFGRSILKNHKGIFIAAMSAALFWRGVNPFLVVIGSGMAGAFLFRDIGGASQPSYSKNDSFMIKRAVKVCTAMAAGLAVLYATDSRLFNLALLMMKIDMFAFGGGFASLPLMLHEIVSVRKWLDSKTFMDGIALGQVTPGPIVITATFVGYLLYGIAGSVVATIAIFTPSFVVLTVSAPIFDRMKTSGYFMSVSMGILSSFVGLLFYVTLKFASVVPWDIMRMLLMLAALAALFKKIDIFYIVIAGAAVSLAIF
ncbi:MAG: chromate efflux transporter [Dissulfurimicrobium sp.]|uniref:chromate efflux transporter n=1 Tax=Dissulfurimicrobium sp. TaxID=2022436 RepID=UPI00404B5D6F